MFNSNTHIPCMNYMHAIMSMVSLKGLVDYTNIWHLVFLQSQLVLNLYIIFLKKSYNICSVQ